MCLLLLCLNWLKLDQDVVELDHVSGSHMNSSHAGLPFGSQRIFHFHSFKQNKGLAVFYGLAFDDFDSENLAWHGRADLRLKVPTRTPLAGTVVLGGGVIEFVGPSLNRNEAPVTIPYHIRMKRMTIDEESNRLISDGDNVGRLSLSVPDNVVEVVTTAVLVVFQRQFFTRGIQ